MSRNPDPQVAAMERARERQTRKARAVRPKIVAAVLALRNGGAALAVQPDATDAALEAQGEGRLMPKPRPNPHDL